MPSVSTAPTGDVTPGSSARRGRVRASRAHAPPSSPPRAVRSSSTAAFSTPDDCSRRSRRTVENRNASTSRRTGNTIVRAIAPHSASTRARSSVLRSAMSSSAVAYGGDVSPSPPRLRWATSTVAASRRCTMESHCRHSSPGLRAASRSPSPLAASARSSAARNDAEKFVERSDMLRRARAAPPCAADSDAATSRGTRAARARVTSFVTYGLPSRSPPTHEPNWTNADSSKCSPGYDSASARASESCSRHTGRTACRRKSGAPTPPPAPPWASRA